MPPVEDSVDKLRNDNRILKKAVAILARHKCTLDSQIQSLEATLAEASEEVRRKDEELERVKLENAQLIAMVTMSSAGRHFDGSDDNMFEGNNFAY